MPVFYLKNDNNKRFLAQLYEEEKNAQKKTSVTKSIFCLRGKN